MERDNKNFFIVVLFKLAQMYLYMVNKKSQKHHKYAYGFIKLLNVTFLKLVAYPQCNIEIEIV